MGCLKPITLRRDEPDEQVVPCGKCPDCLARKVAGWSFRLMQEEKKSSSAYFITLTYGDDNDTAPLSKNGFMEISKRDLQLFFKRLRRLQERDPGSIRKGNDGRFQYVGYQKDKPIKYFAVGEYGTLRQTPHYHIILFNANIKLIAKAWQQPDGKPIGSIYYGDVNGASIGYTLKYISNKPFKKKHKNDDRQKNFQLQSTGLGKSFLTPQMSQWYQSLPAERQYAQLPDGRKIALPRYYRDKIFSDSIRAQIRDIQLERIEEIQLKEMQKQGDLYWHNKDQKAKERFRKAQLDYNTFTSLQKF